MLAFLAARRRAARSRPWTPLAAVVGGSARGRRGRWTNWRRIDAALTGHGRRPTTAAGFDPSVVRGLEYYTGAVFEAELLLDTTDDKGRAGALRLDRRRRTL